MNDDRIALIRALLTDGLQPLRLEIEDESWKHAGHVGAAGGGGHFAISVCSPLFSGKGRIARHRMVYALLERRFGPDIHALSIRATAPEEEHTP